MSDIVKLQIKITGSDSFKEVEVSAKELAEAIDAVKKRSHELNEKLLNANQIAQTIDQVGSAIQSLHSVMRDLTDAYAVQSAAEARLEQMMRNTMDATDAEIQSIKDLAAEQQKLGVIGDEVILSGAQELATYMQKKDSLEALIPVMDDMIAQQYGYNASAESAVSVAQMLGKVFAGETGALKRLGYTFDEAQEAVLKYGTEEEKVAMLTEVVGQIVDGTNAKLAATPYGQIVNARNAFGDLKETLGEMVAPAMNAVEGLANVTIALSGIAKGVVYVKQATAALTAFAQSSRMASTRMAVLRVHSIMTATAQRMLGAAGISAAAGTTALKVAVTGLYAAMTLGLSAAITAIVALITRLANSGREAAEGMDAMKEANEAYKSAASNAKAEIDTEIASLKRLMDQGKETEDAIQHLNEKYGEAFGYHQTAADWYDTLTKKSKIYCAQLGYEAKAKALSSKIANLEIENDEKKRRKRELESRPTTKAEGREYKQLNKDIEDNIKKIGELKADREKAFNESNRLQAQLNGTTKEGAKAVSWQSMSYEELGKAIKEQTDKLKKYSDGSSAEAKQESATLAAMQQRHHQLGVALGLETENVKKLTNEYKKLAKVELVPALETKKAGPIERAALPTTEAGYDKWIADLQNNLKNATADMRPGIQAEIERAEQLRNAFIGVKEEVEKTSAEIDAMPTPKPFETFTKGWGGLKGIGNSIRDIKSALTETNNAWDALTQTIDGFISMFQSVQQVVEIIKTITAATQAMQGVRDAATQKELSNATAEVAANTAKAGSGAASSVASIPYVGPVLAIAAMASVIAALASLPKFANGGLVYGPTLGLMGEYGGASSNPEVIAPLDKLRSLIGGNESGGSLSEVKFRIEGRELVGILDKQTNINRRSR